MLEKMKSAMIAEDFMQYALVILDGASGEPVPEFDGKTSLEASDTPHLDAIACAGSVGLMQNVPSHMVSGSDVACLSLLGYDPAAYAIGRGAIEGAALGIDLKPGQVALRMNLCYVEDGIMRGYSTDNISTEDGHALAQEIKDALDDETFTLHVGTSFRQVLVVDGHPELMGLSYETPHDNSGKDITSAYKPRTEKRGQSPILGQQAGDREKDQQGADLLVAYIRSANEVLAKSPVNARRVAEGKWPANHVWLFWPGMKPGSLKTFEESYHRLGAVNSAVDLLVGLAKMADMKMYRFEGVTDGPNNDFAAQGAGAITMLEDGNDVVVIHVEAPDAAGHDGSPAEKRNAIEQSDLHVLGPLRKYAEANPLRIAVMPDHPTPLSTRKHSHEPVPFAVAGPGIAQNAARRMTEAEAAATGLLFDPGYRFMGDILLAE